MEYVFITMGFKRVFYASDRNEAVRLAFSVAREVRAYSWLLFDRNGTLIFEGLDNEPSLSSCIGSAFANSDKLGHD